ncbi:hypothetical protein [Actinomadura opuntiae]|uniref:hypothetical protein n=1 Tax=Actinomadura sp. OS1-43 TaxID=604315 RepID=UPI00255AD7A9|nr:hypothetical protein [Actinomadura sp. OS1-43]MDL4818272.1 hypothetical protein [Actinomadura sp. OS1-43]
MFGRAPLEERIARRQAELGPRPAGSGGQFDHPTARYLFIGLLAVTVAAHVIGGVLFAVMG